MRRVALFAAVGLTSIAVGTAVAAEFDQGLDISLSPSSPQKKGAAVKKFALNVDVTTKLANMADEGTFATRKAVIHFDKNIVFANSRYPSCSLAQVQQDDTKCKSASRVGRGVAQGKALKQTENLTVTAYDGPGSNKLFLKVVGRTPLEIDETISATLSNDKGKYGKKLTVPITPVLQQPLKGQFATLTRFQTKVSKLASGQSYVSLKSCPSAKKLNFKGDFDFTDGTKKSVTDIISCKR